MLKTDTDNSARIKSLVHDKQSLQGHIGALQKVSSHKVERLGTLSNEFLQLSASSIFPTAVPRTLANAISRAECLLLKSSRCLSILLAIGVGPSSILHSKKEKSRSDSSHPSLLCAHTLLLVVFCCTAAIESVQDTALSTPFLT